MATVERRPDPESSVLSPSRSRLFVISFFLVTLLLAFLAAQMILHNAENPSLRQKIQELRERKERNSLFPPEDTTGRNRSDTTDSLRAP